MAEGDGQGEGEPAAGEPGEVRTGIPEDAVVAARAESGEEGPRFVEVWNDYDPSMRFVVIFPVGEEEGATAGSVAYYIIEPGQHSGVHSDNAEEIVFVTEGEGEVFVMGRVQPLQAGAFVVFPAGHDHDIYAHGTAALRLLSFFPSPEIRSTFQQFILPVAGNVLSSRPPRAVATELDPDDLPQGFPFELAELGLAPPQEGELTRVQRMIGLTKPGDPPPPGVVLTPGEASEAAPGGASGSPAEGERGEG